MGKWKYKSSLLYAVHRKRPKLRYISDLKFLQDLSLSAVNIKDWVRKLQDCIMTLGPAWLFYCLSLQWQWFKKSTVPVFRVPRTTPQFLLHREMTKCFQQSTSFKLTSSFQNMSNAATKTATYIWFRLKLTNKQASP